MTEGDQSRVDLLLAPHEQVYPDFQPADARALTEQMYQCLSFGKDCLKDSRLCIFFNPLEVRLSGGTSTLSSLRRAIKEPKQEHQRYIVVDLAVSNQRSKSERTGILFRKQFE